jgi:hypothetical protein
MVRVLGAALHGPAAPLLAQGPPVLDPPADWLARQAERVPERTLQAIYRRSGWLDAARQYLADHAGAHNVTFGEDRPSR